MTVVAAITARLRFLAFLPERAHDKIPENMAMMMEKKGKF